MHTKSRDVGKFRILLTTNLRVSNREAANAFLSYLACAVGGLFLSGTAIVRLISPGLNETELFVPMFLLFGFMFDYFSLQSKLEVTTLTDNSSLALFPISRFRSLRIRFLLMLLDKRMLFYLLPAIAVLSMLVGKVGIAQLAEMSFLFALVYLIASEIVFPIFVLLRKLASRYSAKTVTQVAAIPFLIVFLLPTIFHFKEDFFLHVPVVSEFVAGFADIVTANSSGAVSQLAQLLLIVAVLAVFLLSADKVALRSDEVLRAVRAKLTGRERIKSASLVGVAALPRESSGEFSRLVRSEDKESFSVGMSLRRCILLDWKIRQKEERVVYTLIMYPVMAAWMGGMMSHKIHKPIDSIMLLIFFIAILLGVAVTENHLTQRGIRLKNVSIFPLDRKKYMLVKSLSVWSLISAVNLLAVALLGFWLKAGAFQVLQGAIYAVYIPLVFVLSVNTLTLYFNSLSRHALIALLIILAAGLIATFVYAMLMVLSFFIAASVVVSLFLLTYFLWIPLWGAKLASEFQTLLEESK